MLIVEFWTDGSLLTEALGRAPDMVIRPEEGYISGETARYIFWGEGGDFDAFEAGLDADSTVTNSTILTELDTRRLYRAESTEQGHNTALQVWRDLDLVLLDGRLTTDGWLFRMRFPDRETLAEFRHYHRARNRPFRLQQLYHEADTRNDVDGALTGAQKDALAAAYEAGHFDVPQAASQADVAARLDISRQALSERLQRGVKTLIEEARIVT